jgi:apolipoprotein N-acyltransferase
LAQSVFRSVETSRSIIRCANSGVSAFIDHNGTVQSYLGPLEQGVLQDEVSFHSSTTVYTLVGDCLVPVSFVGMLLWGAWIFLRERREKDAR